MPPHTNCVVFKTNQILLSILNNPNCDILFIAQLFTLCFIIFFNF